MHLTVNENVNLKYSTPFTSLTSHTERLQTYFQT